jgi:sugar (pentulose or hexulose) kinase
MVMTGGVAQNVAAVHYIEKALGVTLLIPLNPQTAGAYGAALIALDEVSTARAAEETDPQREVDVPPVSCTAPRRARVRAEEHLLQRREKSPAL